jgi:VCBS repeat-containing protein
MTNEDTAGTINVLTNDTFGAGANVTSVTQGANGSITFLANGTVTYTPATDYNGTDSFTYTVTTAAGDTETATVNVTVNSVVDVVNDTLVTDEDTAGTVDVLVNDSFGAGAAVTGITHGLFGTVVNNGDGTVTYTPTTDFNGTDSFTYTVTTAAGDTETATVNVTVNTANDAPVANDVSFTTLEDQILSGTSVLSNDDDSHSGAPGENNTPLTAQLVSGASNGSLVLNTDGTFSYTPNIDFNGSDSFTYQAIDSLSGVSNTATVHITVNPVNDPAIIDGDISGAMQEDINATTGYISANGVLTATDVDTNESSFVPGTLAGLYGSYSIDNAGNWNYQALNNQPDIQSLGAGESVAETFTVSSADGTTQTVVITIHGTDDAAIVTGVTSGEVAKGPPEQTTTVSGLISISDVDASDNPAFNDVTAITGDNAYGDFVLINGTWTYTLDQATVQSLNAGESVTDSITYTATDGSTVQISVNIISAYDNLVITGADEEDYISTTETNDKNDNNIEEVISSEVKEPDSRQDQVTIKPGNKSANSLSGPHLKYIVIPSDYDYGDSDDYMADDNVIRRIVQNIEQMAEKANDITTDILQMFDLLRIQISEPESSANSFMSQSIPAIMLSLSAGMVTWALRGGTLLASMISTIPVWKGFDPLPIIAASRKRREDKSSNPEDMIYNEQVDGMFDENIVNSGINSNKDQADT